MDCHATASAVSRNDGDGAVCVLFMDCHTIATALARNDKKDFTTRIHFYTMLTLSHKSTSHKCVDLDFCARNFVKLSSVLCKVG